MMSYPYKLSLKKLQRQLDVANEPFKQRLLGLELLHILRYYEAFRSIELPSYMQLAGNESYGVVADRGRQAMNTCLRWFFANPKQDQRFSSRAQTSKSHLALIRTVSENIWSYENALDAMNSLWNGLLDFKIENENFVSIEYPDVLSKEIELFEWLKHKFDYGKQGGRFPAWPKLLRSSNVRFQPGNRLEYDLNGSLFKAYRASVLGLYRPNEELSEKWGFGPYTVQDFRKFFNALVSFSNFHASMHDFWARRHAYPADAYPINSCVPVYSKQSWLSRLTRWSGLRKDIVESIFNDLVFRAELHFVAGKKPDASYQPFFELDEDVFALSCFMVISTSFEKNMWDLLSILRPGIFANRSGEKEKFWREELAEKCQNSRLIAYTNIKFKFATKDTNWEGDIDLLILDPKTKFGLACELKWLSGPDRIKEVELRHLAKAFHQCKKNTLCIQTAPEQVAQKIKMPIREFEQYEIAHLVLAKNSTVNGAFRNELVPLVHESVFNWLVFHQQADLRAALEYIKNFDYRPRFGADFIEERYSYFHGQVGFRLSKFNQVKDWQPAFNKSSADIQALGD